MSRPVRAQFVAAGDVSRPRISVAAPFCASGSLVDLDVKAAEAFFALACGRRIASVRPVRSQGTDLPSALHKVGPRRTVNSEDFSKKSHFRG